ncbi:MAG: pentapeptide repeat-containing protein [Acidobacteriota bacterium]
MIVKDRDGNFLIEVDDLHSLDSLDLRRADFSKQVLEGALLIQSDLREADLSGADLYWVLAADANFDGAVLRDAQLNGAKLRDATFRGADLRGAYVSYDNLGGAANLEGADLTDALLDGANLAGCEYNDLTQFPAGFDPNTHGMKWVNKDRIYIRPGSFASAQYAPGYYIPDKDNPGVLIPDKNS